MRKVSSFFIALFFLGGLLQAQDKEVKLKIVQTSDLHGNFYPYGLLLQLHRHDGVKTVILGMILGR